MTWPTRVTILWCQTQSARRNSTDAIRRTGRGTISSRQKFSEYRQQTKHGYDKSAVERRSRSFAQLFVEFLRLLRGHGRLLAVALATLTIATLLKLIPPAATKIAIDYIIISDSTPSSWPREYGLPSDRFQLLLLLTLGVVVVSLMSTAIHLWGRWYATRAVNRVQVTLRKRLFQHMMRLPLHQVYKLKSGGASSVLRDDAGGAADLVFSMIYNPWRAVVQLTGSLIILVCVDWRMMVGGFMLLPVVYVTHRTWIHRIRPLWRDVRKQRQQIDSAATEAFAGVRIVRGFSRERTETSRFVGGNALLVRKQLFVWCWSRIIDVVWSTIIPLASQILLLYGGYRILQGSMTLGDLTMFLFYLAMLLGPLATLVSSAASFQNNLAGLDRILDLLQKPREMQPTAHATMIDPEKVSGRIQFRNVRFFYPGSKRLVLDDINLEIAGGETIALVGRSGSGKTTLCNLVARFYDPTSGNIELDGLDLRDIRVEAYRNLLGIVEQDVFLFDGSVAENIRYGRRGATGDQIKEAARRANAHGFVVELDDGYDTIIGERGVRLSGGQRQRLAIARAMLADPRILILDEATSNLDSESERLIQRSLETLMSGRTCFVIAHRLSTIVLADRIAVIDEGKLAAVGTHHQLLESDETYRRMVDLQTIDFGS